MIDYPDRYRFKTLPTFPSLLAKEREREEERDKEREREREGERERERERVIESF